MPMGSSFALGGSTSASRAMCQSPRLIPAVILQVHVGTDLERWFSHQHTIHHAHHPETLPWEPSKASGDGHEASLLRTLCAASDMRPTPAPTTPLAEATANRPPNTTPRTKATKGAASSSKAVSSSRGATFDELCSLTLRDGDVAKVWWWGCTLCTLRRATHPVHTGDDRLHHTPALYANYCLHGAGCRYVGRCCARAGH